ncbi:GNAT family N-acetyltransferase [Magnetovibrio sp. PR-2]|uniref:GNAT family N-acetyltransferase n=1 Tax=Magnetovibrio sp. PR-2 TaxID=3120356 RepID=UPI002FCE3B09
MMSLSTLQTPTRGAPRSKKSHDAILAAALSLADSGGPQALTIEAVAREAKVGKQTIYRWWPSRIELLIEVYDTLAPIGQKLIVKRAFKDVLMTLFEVYLGGPAGELLAAIVSLSQSSPEAKRIFEEKFLNPRRNGLAHYLELSGTIQPGQAQEATNLVVAQIWFALLTDPALLDEDYAERICRTLKDFTKTEKLHIHEGFVPGFAAEMIRLHMDYYAPHWGLGQNFKTHILRDFTALMDVFDANRDQILTLQNQNGDILGTLVVEASTQESVDTARLRFFVMNERTKGQGWGHKMIEHALATCKARGQTKLWLTTFNGLEAAKSLYERAGFHQTEVYAQDTWNEGTGEVRYDLALD